MALAIALTARKRESITMESSDNQFNDGWFRDHFKAADQAADEAKRFAAVPDIQVVEYLGGYERVDGNGINRLISLAAILQSEPDVTVAVRRAEDIRNDNRRAYIDDPDGVSSDEVAQMLAPLHPNDFVIVVIRK
jgi:hypothetical protein